MTPEFARMLENLAKSWRTLSFEFLRQKAEEASGMMHAFVSTRDVNLRVLLAVCVTNRLPRVLAFVTSQPEFLPILPEADWSQMMLSEAVMTAGAADGLSVFAQTDSSGSLKAVIFCAAIPEHIQMLESWFPAIR